MEHTLAQTHTPTCPWCGREPAACPDLAGHARADRASETTWLRQARGGSGAR